MICDDCEYEGMLAEFKYIAPNSWCGPIDV